MARRRALGDAIRTARGDRTQTEFGDLVAEALGVPVPQGTISRWELGKAELTVEQVRSIEDAVGLPPGTLLLQAGYMEVLLR
jgi:transcriptional regulator with XRE-family HTH domain